MAGNGHSFSPIALTDGTLITLEQMTRVLDVDRATGQVRVEGGATIHALNETLARNGLAFENLGDIDVQAIAGAIATATHGTGGRLRNLSAQVVSLELVLADGSELIVAADDGDADAFRAARVAIGSLGVIAAVTLQAVPAFTLRGVDRPEPLPEVLDSLEERVEQADHFEFFTFPHTGIALTRTNTRVDEPPQPRSRGRAWAEDIALTNGAFGAFVRVGRARPRWIPAINRAVTRAAGSREVVDRSDRIFASPRLVKFTEMEYAIPREHAAEAIRAVVAIAERPEFHVSFPIEVRFVAADDALLSPASDRATCYIAVHMARGMAWTPYFHAVESAMARWDGRPHWGKRHALTAAKLAPRYPGWARFQAVRQRLDPGGTFANAWSDRVLGPVAAARTQRKARPSPR